MFTDSNLLNEYNISLRRISALTINDRVDSRRKTSAVRRIDRRIFQRPIKNRFACQVRFINILIEFNDNRAAHYLVLPFVSEHREGE